MLAVDSRLRMRNLNLHRPRQTANLDCKPPRRSLKTQVQQPPQIAPGLLFCRPFATPASGRHIRSHRPPTSCIDYRRVGRLVRPTDGPMINYSFVVWIMARRVVCDFNFPTNNAPGSLHATRVLRTQSGYRSGHSRPRPSLSCLGSSVGSPVPVGCPGRWGLIAPADTQDGWWIRGGTSWHFVTRGWGDRLTISTAYMWRRARRGKGLDCVASPGY
jgi:hypothetical protein